MEGKIVFSAGKNNDFDIFKYEFASKTLTQLTAGSKLNDCPRWSPDGKRIAFISNEYHEVPQICVMNEDGTGLESITQSYHYHHVINWTADGEGVYLLGNYGEDANELDIWKISFSDPNKPELVLKMEGVDYDISFSRDYSKVLFANSSSGNFEIYEATLSTGEVKQLTHDQATDRFPVYSPDMKKIAFVSCREGWRPAQKDDKGFPVKGSSQGDSDIWIMDADGNNQEKLTDNSGSDLYIRWSPDGKYLVYCAGKVSNAERITLFDIETRKPIKLNYDRTLIENELNVDLPDAKGVFSFIGKILIPDRLERKLFHTADYFGHERYPDWHI